MQRSNRVLAARFATLVVSGWRATVSASCASHVGMFGRVPRLLPHDAAAQKTAWAAATTSFALLQAAAAYGLAFVFAQTGGDDCLFFVLGAGALVVAPGVNPAVDVCAARRRVA
jgi:hypothetical protein